MKKISLLVLLFVFLFATSVGLVLAQNPTPPSSPTPSPTPSLLPKPMSDATNYWNALVQTYGTLIAIGAIILAIVVALMSGLARAIASGGFKIVEQWIIDQFKIRRDRLSRDKRLREYLQDFRDKYIFLDLKSLNENDYALQVRLHKVYIPLRAHGALADEKQRSKETPTAMIGERATRAPELPEWLARSPRLVVVGRAGSGKSTFLKHVAVVLTEAWLQNKPALIKDLLKISFDPLPVPIYFPLSEFARFWQDLAEKDKTTRSEGHALLQFLENDFKRYNLNAACFEGWLAQGRCLIFLDGLDEVKEEWRPSIIAAVESFVSEHDHDKEHPNRYVVASRPEAYREHAVLNRFEKVEIETLDPEQIRAFVYAWYDEVFRRNDQLTPEGARQAESKSKSLLQAIALKDQVRALTETPLLLTLTAMLHHRYELPENRAELYQKCTFLLLGEWDRSRPGAQGRRTDSELAPAGVPSRLQDRCDLLSPAAFWLLQAGLNEAPKSEWAKEIIRRSRLSDADTAQKRIEDFLEWAKNRCNIIEEGETGIYRFAHHRTFQEYLAACYLVSLESEGVITALGLVAQPGWGETLRLMVASFPARSGRQSDFLCRALERPEPEAALLVASCLAELRDPYLDPAIVDDVKQKLLAPMTNAQLPAKETRALAGELLGRLGDPRADVSARFSVVVPVPGGEYWIGSREGEGDSDEHPRHLVRLNDFWIGKYPVTNAQYKLFVDARGYENKDYWTPKGWDWRHGKYTPDLSQIDKKYREDYRNWVEGRKERAQPNWWNDRRWNLDNHPIVGITWFEAMAFCAWLTERLETESPFGIGDWRLEIGAADANLKSAIENRKFVARLPTEAEWEAAARGKAENAYPWGNQFDANRANTSESEIGHTTAVGQYLEGASHCGAFDLAGNVWEWCHSIYKPYPYRADDGRENEKSDALRVLRGGSWLDGRVHARAAVRYRDSPDSFSGDVGVRVVFSPKGSGF